MVEHVYNPETEVFEQLEAAAVEVARLRRKLEGLTDEQDRAVVKRQLSETETRIEALQRRLRQ
ncbi:MAG: hypothetical protein GVY24_05935 [Planctomycetes bacterium]|jgi:polyhydroxyalkanoate synthesis regulator phasin|nr:hypothetical protein [Planctomycetota bacterium]